MREFAVSVDNSNVAAGTATLIFINPAGAPNPNLEFLRYWVGQSANATSAQQRINIETQVTSFPGGAAATPAKLKPSDPNVSVIVGGTLGSVSTAETNCTAEGAGTKTTVWADAFNVLNGWLHVPTPPETRVMPAGFASGQGLFFPISPGTLTGWAYGTCFREI